jgi:exocyst complex component 1
LQSSFFAHFMCFEVPALVPAGSPNANKSKSRGNDPDDDMYLMDLDGNNLKPGTFSCAH